MTADQPHPLDVAVGQRMRERRRLLRLSQQDLAEAIGVSFQQVQKYERGTNRISFSRLVEAAGALNCKLADLTEGLDSEGAAETIEQVNRLMTLEGASQILGAYAALPSDAWRRLVLLHVRGLATALEDGGA